jgi:hypothetical protein
VCSTDFYLPSRRQEGGGGQDPMGWSTARRTREFSLYIRTSFFDVETIPVFSLFSPEKIPTDFSIVLTYCITITCEQNSQLKSLFVYHVISSSLV